MKKLYEAKMDFSAGSIDLMSLQTEKYLKEYRIEQKNIIRIRLSLEEAFLRFRERFGDEVPVTFEIKRKMSRIVISASFIEEPFNPLGVEDEEIRDMCNLLLGAAGLNPQYSYTNQKNELRIDVPLPGMNPVLKIVVAVAGGLLLGLLGRFLVPSAAKPGVINNVFSPLYNVWIRLLNILSGPVIFFMALNTVLNTGKIYEHGGNGMKMVGRFFAISTVIAALSLEIGRLLFITGSSGNTQPTELSAALNSILDFVPDNLLMPFLNSNTPQLLALAGVIGVILNILDSKVKSLIGMVREINLVGMNASGFMSRMVPYFACILLGLNVLTERSVATVGLWKCFAAAILISAVCMLGSLIHVGIKKKTNIPSLIKKLKEPFFIALKAGSLDASYAAAESGCIKDLGINKRFTDIMLPNGLVLYMPISMVGSIIFTVYAASVHGIETSVLWFAMDVVLTVFLFVATPPVPGANLLAYVALFSILGIPGSGIVDAMIFDIVFGIFANAANQAMLQLEMVLQADKIGMLDSEILHGKNKDF